MRSKDRLDELLIRAGEPLPARPRRASAATSPAAPAPPPGACDKHLADLLDQVEVTHRWVDEIQVNTQLMHRLQCDPTFHSNHSLQEQLDAAATRCHALGLKASGALRQLEAAGAARGAAGGAAARAARLHAAAARRRLATALREHHGALLSARDTRRSLLQHQLRLTNLTMTDEECEALLDTNDVSMFVDNLQAETAGARLALRDAEARHAELARVELALRDLHALFHQLAVLVAAQQEQVDTVEYYALQATEHVESGGQELLKGTVIRKKARNKRTALIICLVCGFLLIFLILVYV